MKTTAVNSNRTNKKLKKYIADNIRLNHFNEEYEEVLEEELYEMNLFLTKVSDVPNSIYNYVSTNVSGSKHKWC